VFNLSDLPLYEVEIIEAHWKPSVGVGGVLRNITSQRRTCPLATLSWDNGKELRVYHLGPGNVLQESVYSERETMSKWNFSDLHKLQVVLSPKSSLAAIQWHEEIRLYYQDRRSGIIHELRKASPVASWAQSTINLKSVKHSSLAAVVWINDGIHIRVYYQDPELYLRAYCQDRTRGLAEWTHTRGLFKHGPHPSGTPIAADVLQEHLGSVRISLSWKDEKSQLVNISQEVSSQMAISPTHPQSDSVSAVDGSG
jgi:hypothetical protein